MARVKVETTIAASAERCFDAASDITLHASTLAHTGERAVAGRTSGLIELGETVTWEARHLGVRQRFTAQVTAFDRPYYFRDIMIRGAFRSFAHDHFVVEVDGQTLMSDVLEFRSPLGVLGRFFDKWFLTAYLRRWLAARGAELKAALEGSISSRMGGW